MKGGHKIINTVHAFKIFMSSFSILSFSANDPSVSAWSSTYMPVCSRYVDSSFLPYGEDQTLVICYVPPQGQSSAFLYYEWFFLDVSFPQNDSYDYTFVPNIYNSRYSLNLSSQSPIYHYYSPSHNNVWVFERIGTYQQINTTYYYSVYNYSLSGSYTTGSIVSNYIPLYAGITLESARDNGIFPVSAFNGNLANTFLAKYPDSVKTAIDSISDNQSLLIQYYQSLSGKLNSLSSDHQALYNQNNELQSQVSDLQSQLANQNSEFSSQLNQAQSEIQSNANAAASQAADDVNNAGEDISDIDTNINDVNSIVSKLQEWIQVLNGFADNLEDTEENVVDALESGKSLINQFFEVCPPIVVAVFGFALTFLVVRKIIGR